MPPKGTKAGAKKPRAAAKGAGPSSKATCMDVLKVVPDLAKAGGRSKNKNHASAGTGPKKLRVPSQGVGVAAQQAGAVQGYTLQLGDKAQSDDLKAMAFLNTCQLLRLTVVVPSPASSSDASIVKVAAATATTQLTAFISNTSHALSSVTHLTLTLPPTTGCDDKETTATKSATAMLLPLAAACPQLQHLTVFGRIGSSFLAHFGSNCPNLTSLSAILTNLAPTTLTQLPTLLPHITTLQALTHPSPKTTSTDSKKTAEAANVDAICTSLQACGKLLSVDIGLCKISEEMWGMLPKGLQSLTCNVPSYIPRDEWEERESLHTLVLKSGTSIGLCPLVGLLSSCPNVKHCTWHGASVLDVSFSVMDAEDLYALDEYLSTGLALSPIPSLNFKFPDYRHGSNNTKDRTSVVYEHSMATFFEEHMIKPMYNFTVLDFNNDDGNESEAPGDLTHIARAFPNLEELSVHSMHVAKGAEHALVACGSLRELSLVTVDGFAGKGLRTLCSKNKALQQVTLYGCRGITVKEEAKIAVKGKLSKVVVNIERGEVLEDEDDKRNRFNNWSDDEDRRGRGGYGSGSDDEDGSDDRDERDRDGGYGYGRF